MDHSTKRRRIGGEAGTHFSDVEVEEYMPSDVEMVVNDISKLSRSFHGFVFLHQVYATLENKTVVDEQVAEMRLQSRKWKFFNFGTLTTSTTSSHCSTVLVRTRQYWEYLAVLLRSTELFLEKVDSAALVRKFRIFVESSSKMSFTLGDIQSCLESNRALGDTDDSSDRSSSSSSKEHLLSSAELTWLVTHGFLKPQSLTFNCSSLSGEGNRVSDDEVFWLWHTGLGPLSVYMDNAEKTILSWIGKTKYRELPQSELVKQDTPPSQAQMAEEFMQNKSYGWPKKKLIKYSLGADRNGKLVSALPVAYHLLDLLGKKKIYKTRNNATNDFIIRLAK